MQGMVWGEPERGSAQNGVWKCDGDDSSHDSISSVSIASVIQHWSGCRELFGLRSYPFTLIGTYSESREARSLAAL